MFFEVIIDQSNLGLLSAIIPQTYMHALSENELKGVAVYENTVTNGNLVGVVLFRECYQWQRIEWVGLTGKYSDPRYGADLICMRTDAASAAGQLYGTFADCSEDDDLFSLFLKDAGFAFLDSKSDIHEFTLDQVIRKELPEEAVSDNVLSLEALSDEQKQAIAYFMGNCMAALPVPKTLVTDRYEQELSAVYMKGKQIRGVLLCSLDEKDLVLDFFYALTKEEINALLSYSYHAAVKKYGEKQNVCIPVMSETSEKRIKKLVKGFERAGMKKAIYPCRINRKNRNAEEMNHAMQQVLGVKVEAEREQKQAYLSSAEWVRGNPAFALSKLYKKAEKKNDPAAARLGLEVAMIPSKTLLSRGRITAAYPDIPAGHRKEEVAHIQRARLECCILPGMRTLPEEETRILAARAAEIYRAGKAKLVEPDGTEFNPFPAPLNGEGQMDERIASILAYRDAQRQIKTDPKTPAEKAEEKYRKELLDLIDKVVESYFGSYGMKLEDPGKSLSKTAVAAYIEQRNDLVDQYRGLVADRKYRIALYLEKLLADNAEYQKYLKKRNAESEQEAETDYREERERYSGKGTDKESAPIIEKVIAERDKTRRSLFAVMDSISAAIDSGYMGEYADELEVAHRIDLSIRNFFMNCGQKYLEQLIGGEKVDYISGLFVKWHYKGDADCIDPDFPIERQARKLSDDYRKLPAWDYDNRGVLSSWSEWADRMGLHKVPEIWANDEDSIRDGYKKLLKMRSKYHRLHRKLESSTLLYGIPALFEIFALAKKLRETGEDVLTEEEMLEVEAVYRTMLRRAVYISYIAEKTVNEAGQVQTRLDRTAYLYVYKEIKEIKDADKDKL